MERALRVFEIPPRQFLANPTDTRQTLYCVGAFIFTHTTPTRLLLIRRAATERAFPGLWEVPGGGAELTDATLLDTVVREVAEETGLRVTEIVEFLEYLDFRGGTGRGWRKHNFIVEVEKGDVVTDPAEHDEFGWFEEEEAEKLRATTESMRKSITDAFKRAREIQAGEGKEDKQ